MSLRKKYSCFGGLPREYLFDEIQVSKTQEVEVRSIIREELNLSSNRMPNFIPFEVVEKIMERYND